MTHDTLFLRRSSDHFERKRYWENYQQGDVSMILNIFADTGVTKALSWTQDVQQKNFSRKEQLCEKELWWICL